MEMFNENLPIEYYGIDSCNYPFPTTLEKIIIPSSDIGVKSIIKVYSTIDLIFNSENVFFNNVHCCICNINLNIEYIDNDNDDTISIFSNCIYAPLQYTDDSLNSLSPKISHLHLRCLDNTSISVYLAVYPY